MQATIVTTDIFHAAYLLSLCECDIAVTRDQRNRVLFETCGNAAHEINRIYSDGLAFVALVPFKEAFYELLDRSGQAIGSIKP